MSDLSEAPAPLYRPDLTVGILGGGQLGRMLALAGYPLGLRFRILDPVADAPAGQLAEHIVADYTDHAALERFARGLDVVTYEFENVPVETARFLAARLPVYPPPAALEAAQDRFTEKAFFRTLEIPTPPFAPVDNRAELDSAVATIGLPAVLKTRRFGYDGKGQFIIRRASDIERAWNALTGQPLILEGLVNFRRELSILAVRSRDGGVMAYPLVENHHEAGILRLSLAPAPDLSTALEVEAVSYAAKVLQTLDYVGVLAIELFEVDGKLLASEMAPRVHNSGHWTIEGAETSQFEAHLRAILDLPGGATNPRGYSAMLNLIGTLPDATAALDVPGAHLHLYGKQPRPGRKLGHITLRADDRDTLQRRLARLQALITALGRARTGA